MAYHDSVWEFRPLPNFFQSRPLRYAEGKWIADDGEYDMAFITGSSSEAPIAYYISVEERENILCSWMERTNCNIRRPHYRNSWPNPWHYALVKGKRDRGEFANVRYSYPNRVAGDSAMSKCSSIHRCANGRAVQWEATNPLIAAGLLRNKETKEIFRWPEGLKCMYCGETPYHTIEMAKVEAKRIFEAERQRRLREVENKLDLAWR